MTTTTIATPSATDSTAQLDDDTIYYGDVNLDGTVSLSDIVLLAQHCADISSLNDTQKAAADCNRDSIADAEDLTILTRFELGIIGTIPIK